MAFDDLGRADRNCCGGILSINLKDMNSITHNINRIIHDRKKLF